MTQPSQALIAFFEFIQTTPSVQWNINHGLGSKPMIEINAFDDNNVLQKAFPESVIQVDDNNVQVNWTSARRGFASLISNP
jgi:hypothetical protein